MFSKLPVKGMRDIMPDFLMLRENVLNTIKKIYRSYGFMQIETPCVEDIKLLTGKDGGENEKLIFKILKRGEKLDDNSGELCDYALRYDLTVPLTRYYANNCAALPSVFKAMQIGNVWRADRPQKGRFRQFVQCDIDILGESSYLAECELIEATTDALSALGFDGFTVRINDRKILKALAQYAGFDNSKFDDAFIAMDKLDKIGRDGVRKELIENNCGETESDRFLDAIDTINNAENPINEAQKLLGDTLEGSVAENLNNIFTVAKAVTKNCRIVFDITLVRGMNYYTGTIFEISMDGVGYSVAGGGRYDELLGKFTGKDVPACGFSIGFERIVTLLYERENKFKEEKGGIIYIIDKNAPVEVMEQVFSEAKALRENGSRVLIRKRMKNFKLQISEAYLMGYNEAMIVNNDGTVKTMPVTE